MEVPFVSTQFFSSSTRLAILKLQKQLSIAQKEVASGRFADVGEQLGGATSRTISMRASVSRLDMIVDTNATATTRLDTTQSTLDNFVKTAQTFMSTLITARSSATGPQIIQTEAKANLMAFIDGLNGSVAGENVFAGIRTDTAPVTDYIAGSSNKVATDAAFLTEFGFPQTDTANVATITASAMQTFLDGSFDDLFEEPAWSGNWSDASYQNVESRISRNQTLETSSNANYVGYRKLAKAYTMLADLSVPNLNRNAFDAIVDKAMSVVGEAIQDLAVEQSRLGTSQARIKTANDRMASEKDILINQINAMEAVDPYDASTRVTTLMTQIETAYSLTARIQKLTLLNYL